LSQNLIFLKPVKTYVHDHYVYPFWNMDFITKNYRVSVSFCHNLAFFGKTEDQQLWILSRNLKFFKTRKNLYMGPLRVSDPEYGLYGQKIWSFGQFLPQTSIFQETQRLTALDFEPKFEIFKTHKNIYTEPLWVSDPEFGLYDQEIWSFGQFLLQTRVFP
jgi:hypothetical protein